MEKKIKILHLATDEKFIMAAEWVFEQAFPKQNTFFIVVEDIEQKPKYIEKQNNFSFLNEGKDTFIKVLSDLANFDIIILHGLDYFKSRIVLKASKKHRFMWILWGGEVYENPYIFGNTVYGKATYQRFVKNPYDKFIYWFRPLFYLVKHHKLDAFSSIKRAANKVAALSILLKEDYELFLQKGVISPNTKYVKFTYYPMEFIFEKNKDLKVNSNNILLGNSASASNNHLEAFDILEQFDLENRKVITTLSYGRKDYAEAIIKIGHETLGDCFTPLIDFIPLDEYNKTTQSCGIVVMNHYRQQAVGNILAMMWMGAKVYLDERNTIFPYLKRIGCKVYSITKDLKPDNETALMPMSNKEVLSNREILIKEIGADKVISSLKGSLLSLCGEVNKS